MAEEGTPPPPPKKRTPNKTGISAETYERMAQIWLTGARSIGEVQRGAHVARQTVRLAIKTGWPHKGWASLTDRAREYDEAAKTKKLEDVKDPTRPAWEELRKQDLQILAAGRGFGANLINYLFQAMGRVTDSKVIRVPRVVEDVTEKFDPKGRVISRTTRRHTVMDAQVTQPHFTEIAQAFRATMEAMTAGSQNQIKVLGVGVADLDGVEGGGSNQAITIAVSGTCAPRAVREAHGGHADPFEVPERCPECLGRPVAPVPVVPAAPAN